MAAFYTHSRNRHLPSIVKLGCIFGGSTAAMGWIFFGFLSLTLLKVIPEIDFYSLSGEKIMERVTGTIVSSEETNLRENDSPVIQYLFHFTYNGENYEGVSYGAEPPSQENLIVLVPRDDPEYAVLYGYRRTLLSVHHAFLIGLPLLGLFFIRKSILRGLHAIKLLRDGQLAEGTFLHKEYLGSDRNQTPNFRVYFEFKTVNGQKQTISEKTRAIKKLKQDEKQLILYSPDNPSDGMLVALLPGSPKMTDGQKVEGSLYSALSLTWPILSVLLNGATWLI